MFFVPALALLCLIVAGDGTVTLTQTHPAAPYVCRTGSITLRCQYGGVENVLGVVWAIGNETTTTDPSTISGHTALPRTTTYQEVGVDSYTNSRKNYRCDVILSNGTVLPSNEYDPMIDSAEVTLSNLTLVSRTATTLSVTWSAGYPKCYSFTVSHSTQHGNVTQPADSDTSHTLTSLQPSTTYRIEVKAVRKGDGADGQRDKVIGNFTTENSNAVPPMKPAASVKTAFAGAIAGGVIGGVLLILVLVILVVAMLGFLVLRRKTMPGAKVSAPKTPSASQEGATQGSNDAKQTYAVLDWQNPEQHPVKAPDNEWFTVQYSEVQFHDSK